MTDRHLLPHKHRHKAVTLGLLLMTGSVMSYTHAANTSGGSGPWPGLSGLAASANSAQTALTNPAGMSHFHTEETMVRFAYIHSEEESTGTIDNLGLTTEDEDANDLFIPTFFYTKPINDTWDFGFSIAAPGGFGDDYGENGLSRYFATEWSLVYIGFNPSLSYKINDKLSIGATLGINYSSYTIESKVLNLDSPGTNDGDMELEADDISLSYNLGILYSFSDKTRAGLVYRSSTETELEGEPDFTNLSNTNKTAFENAGLLGRDVKIEGELPGIINLGIYHELDSSAAISADLMLIQWSDFKLTEFSFIDDSVIQQTPDYDDSYFASLAYNFPVTSRLRLGTSASYLKSPIDDEERSLQFRIDDVWMVGVGGEYRLSNEHSLSINFIYGQNGKGKVESRNLPIVGKIEGEYDSRDFYVVDITYKW